MNVIFQQGIHKQFNLKNHILTFKNLKRKNIHEALMRLKKKLI